jgi:hypothetical protein
MQLYLQARGHVVLWLPAITLILLMLIASLFQVFYPLTDPARYQCYALTFWLGSQAIHLLPASQCAFLYQSHPQLLTHPQGPFHLLPIEYPPLTLLFFSLPLLAPMPIYQVVFVLMMSLLAFLTYWLLLRYAPPGPALVFLLYTLLGVFALVQMRYDLLPASMTLLCLLAISHKRWLLAYVALAFGVLLKIYPLLLLPTLFIAEQQTHSLLPSQSTLLASPRLILPTLRSLLWRNTLLFFGIILLISTLFALIDLHDAVVSQVQYFLQRPVQIESTSASILWLAHGLGTPWSIAYTFGSINIISPLDTLISHIANAIFVVGVLFVLWRQWCGTMTFAQASVGLLLLFITTGKVFSPQYLIWLIPLLAYTFAATSPWLWLWSSISLLTTVIYAYFYSQLTDPNHIVLPVGFFPVIALRNALFVFLTLSYLCNWFTMQQQTSQGKKSGER